MTQPARGKSDSIQRFSSGHREENRGSLENLFFQKLQEVKDFEITKQVNLRV